jgi:hypothetical protein
MPKYGSFKFSVKERKRERERERYQIFYCRLECTKQLSGYLFSRRHISDFQKLCYAL